MSLKFTTVTTSAKTTETVRLYHGTDLASALDIKECGVDYHHIQKAKGHGEFWATTSETAAAQCSYCCPYALDNPDDYTGAVVSFDLSSKAVEACMDAGSLVYDDVIIQFNRKSFRVLNDGMQNVSVIVIG
jgi:hypothetical protein